MNGYEIKKFDENIPTRHSFINKRQFLGIFTSYFGEYIGFSTPGVNYSGEFNQIFTTLYYQYSILFVNTHNYQLSNRVYLMK